MTTASYFQSASTCQATCVLLGYFDLLTFDLDIIIVTLKILMTFTIQILFRPVLRKLYIIDFSHFQDRSILHGTFALLDYFDILPFCFYLENVTFTLNFCSDHYSETINSNCFIYSGHINLLLDLCIAGLFWPFNLDITITMKILPGSPLANYKWHLLIFSGHIKLKWDLHTIILTFLTFALEIMTFDIEILFENSFSAHPRCIQCQCYIWSLSLKWWLLTLKSCSKTLFQPSREIFSVNVIFYIFKHIICFHMGLSKLKKVFEWECA